MRRAALALQWIAAAAWLFACAACESLTVKHEPAQIAPPRTSYPDVGDIAPDFTLPNHEDRPQRLSELRGRWIVLYFYPADGTPGCTREALEFDGLFARFGELNATVIGVSPDAPAAHRFFRARHELRIDLLSDEEARVLEQYGAWRRSSWQGRAVGRVVRSTVIIDPAGRIAWRWPLVSPDGHAEQVRRKLADLQQP